MALNARNCSGEGSGKTGLVVVDDFLESLEDFGVAFALQSLLQKRTTGSPHRELPFTHSLMTV